jgi:hypothetical protein
VSKVCWGRDIVVRPNLLLFTCCLLRRNEYTSLWTCNPTGKRLIVSKSLILWSISPHPLGDRFEEMFDVSCNGRWPSRGYQPYKGTHEEELEDIQIRMEEPRRLPSFDDLVLAQSDSLTPVQIWRYVNL